jgi:sugar/nucleoside kinase (ribokinase family)
MYNPGSMELAKPNGVMKLLKDVDLLLVNKREAQQLVPGVLLEELLSKLMNVVPMVVITEGARGAIASDGKNVWRVGMYEDVKVVDVTGAGDAFGAGLLAAIAAGKSFRDALVFASANSTSVVNKIGAKAGILTMGKTKLHAMPIQEVR